MARENKPTTVIAAMIANLTIAVAKFVAATVSGSAAMFAEGIHSVVDTCNQGLVLIGVKRSHRPADVGHPFGYGKEIYFWALIYAVLLFGIGGGLSIYEGIDRIRHPRFEGGFVWSYSVLGVAFLAESTSFVIAVRAVQRKERGRRFLDKLLHSKAPTRFLVVGEDGAAILGLATAAGGLALTQVLGDPLPDAVASLVIGAILCGVALYLTLQTKRLILGQAADPEIVESIRQMTSRRDDVEYAGAPLTMHFGPDRVLVALDLTFRAEMSATEVARAVDEIETDIRRRHPEVERIYVEAQLLKADIEREQPHAGT